MIEKDTLTIIVWIWIGIAIVLFPILLKVTAPYGRHSKKSWGPMIGNRTGWILMELPALLVFSFFVISGGGIKNAIVQIAFFLWFAHYINRSLIFPIRIQTKNKKIPVSIVGLAFFFNLVNGFVNGYWLGYFSDSYAESWILDPRFILGVLLFIAGFAINQYYDHKLIRLRRKNAGYQIPQGGLFRIISCPNFLGEIVEWGGFALLAWNLPALSFFIWTAVNLIPRALDHHKWYKSYFNNYPANRKAIFPRLL